ncbi:MAG: DUF4058 family protein [Dehalococcoidia bacterium]|nr:DUF4058 family protein [Dehalococcoidia bacterium]
MTTQLSENPFAGMNPYLERPELWHGIHQWVIAELARTLGSQLRPDYLVRIEQRAYVSEEPDTSGRRSSRIPDIMVLDPGWAAERAVALETEPRQTEDAITVELPALEVERENYLKIIRVSNREVVAVLELLSPTNKSSKGRQEYLSKRAEVQYSLAHLVEIDLLRAGPPMPVVGDVPGGDYRILISNARLAPDASLYVFSMRQPIPIFMMPLAQGSEGIAIDLNPIIDEVYILGSYDRDIDYQQDPEPPLSDSDRIWLDQLLREKGLRDATV